MQHGMHNAIDMLSVEREQLDHALKYHYLIVDERLQHPRSSLLARFAEYLRSIFSPRPMVVHERGI